MSSSMLEQAVIDAKELREAAMKTAEDELLKKYSSQIKEAVDNLLSTEEPSSLSEEEIAETENVIDELEMKALDGESNSDLEEGEMVEINLDELKEELEKSADDVVEGSMGSGLGSFGDDSSQDSSACKKLASDWDVSSHHAREAGPHGDGAARMAMSSIADKAKASNCNWSKNMAESVKEELEEVEISEENIAAVIEDILSEKVTVDYEFVPTGNLGTTHPTKVEQEYSVDAALVTSMDEEEKENIQDLHDMIKTLEEQVKSIELEKNKLNEDYSSLKKTAVKAANKLEELNFSNAKLLYQKRVLESVSLNERQKTKLVESISNAQNITEARVIVETSANLGEKAKAASPQNLSEVSSKNTQLILKSNKNASESSVNEQTSLRMKKLAGLI